MSWVLGWVWILCSFLFPLCFFETGCHTGALAGLECSPVSLSFPESIVTDVSMPTQLVQDWLTLSLEIRLTVDNKSLQWLYISGCQPLLLVLTCSSCCLPVVLSFLSKLCSSGVCQGSILFCTIQENINHPEFSYHVTTKMGSESKCKDLVCFCVFVF